MKLSAKQLIEMAYRGAEDGHSDDWHRELTQSDRVLMLMREAADKARINLIRNNNKTQNENRSER